jgi:hypothetical protein
MIRNRLSFASLIAAVAAINHRINDFSNHLVDSVERRVTKWSRPGRKPSGPSLLSRIKKAKTPAELIELLRIGSTYTKARGKTRRRWGRAAALKYIELA